MNDKVLSMLGLCMKAGKLGAGHDASKQSARLGSVCLCLMAQDASERLIGEMRGLMEKTPFIVTEYTMDDIKRAIGRRAGVVTVNDGAFAEKLLELLSREGSV